MKYTKENIIDGINIKVNSLIKDEDLRTLWKQKLADYPKELEQNVLEWINDMPISEIECHGESILKTMRLWNVGVENFVPILLGFIDFKNNGFRNNSLVSWHISTGIG